MGMSDRIGVLGASGYVGTAVVRTLRANGYDVRPAAGSSHETYPTVDVRDRAAVRSFVDGLDAVVNAAGLVGIGACDAQPELAFEVNAAGAANVAWACHSRDVPLVYLSSVAALGDPEHRPVTAANAREPTSVYGRTKLLGERAVGTLSGDRIPGISFCVTNVYGAHEGASDGGNSVADFFVERGCSGEALPVHRPGTQERDLVHVRDVADAVVAAIGSLERADPSYESYVLGSGTAYSVLELAGLIASELRAAAGRSPGIELHDPPNPDSTVIERFEVDPSPLEAELGFTPDRDVREWIATEIDRRMN